MWFLTRLTCSCLLLFSIERASLEVLLLLRTKPARDQHSDTPSQGVFFSRRPLAPTFPAPLTMESNPVLSHNFPFSDSSRWSRDSGIFESPFPDQRFVSDSNSTGDCGAYRLLLLDLFPSFLWCMTLFLLLIL